MLHALPGLMEQAGQSQCVSRPARPSAADFVNPTVSAARLCLFFRENSIRAARYGFHR
jgi:hypothetical protein